jgi:hypothetical protein
VGEPLVTTAMRMFGRIGGAARCDDLSPALGAADEPIRQSIVVPVDDVRFERFPLAKSSEDAVGFVSPGDNTVIGSLIPPSPSTPRKRSVIAIAGVGEPGTTYLFPRLRTCSSS